MSSATLRIGLNATTLLSPLTGIGQYTSCLASALSLLKEVDLHLFYAAAWSREIRTQPVTDIARAKNLFKALIPWPYTASRLLTQPRFTRGVHSRRIELYHEPGFFPYAFRGPTVITIQDLSWIRYPEAHPIQRVRALTARVPGVIERADHILVLSEFVKKELLQEFSLSASKITVTSPGARISPKARDDRHRADTLRRFGLEDKRYFLYVGTLEPRKNIQTGLRAHARLKERDRVPLVLVGVKGWLNSSLERAMHGPVSRGEVKALGFLQDDELSALYSAALAVTYPSIYEGFGLPPLEAMACGTPAIVSNAASLPEVVGENGMMHDPQDDEALHQYMEQMLHDQEFRLAQERYSLHRAAQFSWDRCAQATLDVYRRAVDDAEPRMRFSPRLQ